MDRRAERYELARELYASVGVDTEVALAHLGAMPVSIPCWQGDDVAGFEGRDTALGGGLAVTGAHPGRARNADELRGDLEFALRRIPGRHRVSLHASYAETGGVVVDRNALEPTHFARWRDWAGTLGVGLDFNPTYFAHPNASAGWTLAHPDAALRRFWIEHGQASRRIAASFGASQATPALNNVWIPDGAKEVPWDRSGPRERLRDALDQVFLERFPAAQLVDAVESKLFGIGSEGYVVGSHEFYLGYAASRQIALCLDSGHFHPTESIADKISSVLLWVPQVLLHVSRGVRWDSDHVVLLDDDTLAISREVVRAPDPHRIHLGLDFFDASINRVAAWILGCRNLLKALLYALLQPHQRLSAAEANSDATARLAWFEESKGLPWGAVWDEHCRRQDVAIGPQWLADVQTYERQVLTQRG